MSNFSVAGFVQNRVLDNNFQTVFWYLLLVFRATALHTDHVKGQMPIIWKYVSCDNGLDNEPVVLGTRNPLHCIVVVLALLL